jgi:glycosyltransferase involved in cell wall biosynthesis
VGLGFVVSEPDLEVVLPTYNGAAYLEAQLASIFAQTLQPRRVLLRDDGSRDGTPALIERLQGQYGSWLKVLTSDANLGCTANVGRLLEASAAAYVALADQDDLWWPDKLERSLRLLQELEAIHGPETPLLVHTDLELVDEQGARLGETYLQRQRLDPTRTGLVDLVLTNVVTGCTVLCNRALLTRALPIPEQAVVHDWWLALVASALGRIEHLPLPSLSYRQHRDNVLGAPGTTPRAMVRKLFLPPEQRPPMLLQAITRQLQELRRRYQLSLHPLEVCLSQSRWQRIGRLLGSSSLRRSLRKHGRLRTWAFWVLLVLTPRQAGSGT